ncbi:pentapeptide repeat-containing protein [Sorangium sp. So ce1153]|uniref:WD40 domain-containing protein n=1 Tax=Sorangium sp. So ce1153 TaxID=3133333 RepID=UPI003F5E1640
MREPAHAPNTAAERTDVVILTALHDELEALLALGDGGRPGWEEHRDQQRFRYFRRRFRHDDGSELAVAAAWIGEMGERAATSRGQQLVQELNPTCLAMCGICAGWRKKVALGDIVVADRLYSYDHGKLVAATKDGTAELFHDLETFSLEKAWKMDASFLARALSLGDLAEQRPPSPEAQRLWLLQALYAHEKEGAPAPAERAERRRVCPDYAAILERLDADKLVDLDADELALTELGHKEMRRQRRLYPDGRALEAPLQIHVGAMATGKTVRADPTLFERLERAVRSTLAVDMEGMAVAELAERLGRRSLVVKAVSDHADHTKDDRFRAFACKASATFLLAFLQRYLDLDPLRAALTSRDPRELERPRVEGHHAGFLGRIEQVSRLRAPSARFLHHELPRPFDGALELLVSRTPITHRELLVALDQPVTDAALALLARDVLPFMRREGPLPCRLIHRAPTAAPELALRAHRLDVELTTFEAYQGLIDFSRYTAWLSARLAADDEYPPWLYVEQPADVSLAGQRPQRVPSALATLRDQLATSERRFSLILGDFGAGKSFLLRELSRRLIVDGDSLVPVLVEMRYLEKQPSLRALLAQHFGAADVGAVDIDAFLYMLHEGRVVLLFDGFDELAVRVTYDQVLQHFAVITSAVEGKAKVIVSSRRQHFLDDGQVKLELARNAERLQGYRLVELCPFEETQIRQFLRNRLKTEAEAAARYQLIDDVKDLLGLSHNPRMLSFIAELEPERLELARKTAGEITPAKLYEVLIDRWLEGECARTQVKKESLWRAVRAFARKLWETPGNVVDLASLPKALVPRLEGPKQALSEEEARLVLGSRSLLKRSAEGMFSFVHRSVMEWLVVVEAAEELTATESAPVLDVDTMSPLMARFFVNLAGREAAEGWARRVFAARTGATPERNAYQVAAELRLSLGVDLEERDLRGQSLKGIELRGANLRGANLEGVALGGRDLSGADLSGARLARADLRGAVLAGADLSGADLTFVRLSRANLSGAKLAGARLLGADLLGVRGLAEEVRVSAAREGAAVSATATWERAPPSSRCWVVAYHPGGHLLATGHDDGTVRLWDAAMGQVLRVLDGHAGSVLSVAFSPDGRSLASGSHDETVRLWDVATGQVVRVLEGHTAGVWCVAFSPDGKSLASGARDETLRLWDAATAQGPSGSKGRRRFAGMIRLWDVATGRALRALEGHTERVLSVAFSSDGRSLASCADDKTVRLWDAATGQVLRVLEGHAASVWSVAFSPDGRSLASGSDDETVRLWDAATGQVLRALEGHAASVWSVAFSPEGRSLASGSMDQTVRLWDVATGQALRVLGGHTASVWSVAFSPDGRSLASGSRDQAVRLWDVATGQFLRALRGHAETPHEGRLRPFLRGQVLHALGSCTERVSNVAFSPDGRMLVSGSNDRMVRLWDVATGKVLRALAGHAERVSSVAFSADGRSLASGSDDRTVRLWDVATGQVLHALEGHTERVNGVAFSADGRSLASGSDDRTVRLWDVATGQVLHALEGHAAGVSSVAFSADGRSLASGSDDRTVRLWDVATGQVLHALEGHAAGVSSVAFSSDGRVLASGSDDTTVWLWDAATGQVLHALAGHAAGVSSVVFNPDGRSLSSSSADETVRMWDVATGQLLRGIEGVSRVTFSPDGVSLASASDDGTIRLWVVDSGCRLAVLLTTPESWGALVPEVHPGGPLEGPFDPTREPAGSVWHIIGLARFEPGELDDFLAPAEKLCLSADHTVLPR